MAGGLQAVIGCLQVQAFTWSPSIQLLQALGFQPCPLHSQYPKDFRRIATFLPGRSAGECVAFFYKHQKTDEFAAVRRKQQLKKRRLHADARKSNM